MNVKDFPDIPPRRKRFKRLVNRVMLFCLGRALQSLSKHDRLIQREVESWPEGFTLMLRIRPRGSSMAVSRLPGGRLVYRGARFPEAQTDVVIYIKNGDTAFKLLTGQMGIDVGYARHGMIARGDLSNTVSVVRVLNVAEAYLFPSFLARHLMKRLPPIPRPQKYLLRAKAYLLGVPFGI